MAASFIKKNDGNYYLRLTENTTSVKFAAVSQAGNTYTFYINGTGYISKPYSDSTISNEPNGGITYYTSSASPVPAGGNLDNGRFPGTETAHYFSGSGTRDYYLSFDSSPTPGTFFALGGEALYWGGYAYPGDGYVQNSLSVGIKLPYGPTKVPFTRYFSSALSQHFFTAKGEYEYILINGYQVENYNAFFLYDINQAQPQNTVRIVRFYKDSTGTHIFTTLNTDEYYILLNDPLWKREGEVGFAYVSPTSYNTPIYRAFFPQANDYIFTADYNEYVSLEQNGWNADGIAFYAPTTDIPGSTWKSAGNMFIKNNGSWREISNAYIKQNGVWRKFYQNFGNSSWINMIELTDDAIDFGVQVIALN